MPKLITVVLHFSLFSIQIFHPLLMSAFPFISGSLPSSSLIFLSILQCVPTSIVISCAEPYQMPFLSLNICNPPIHLFLVLYLLLMNKNLISWWHDFSVLNPNCLFVIIPSLSKYSVHCFLMTFSHILHTMLVNDTGL